MNFNSKFKENKSIIYIFFIGILISSFYSIYNINKFEKNEKNGHLMIRGDLKLIWREAYAFKKDLTEKENFLGNGIPYTRTFLPSKTIALYSFLRDQNIYENIDNETIKEGKKLIYLFFQIILYYLSLLYLYKKLLLFYDGKNISILTIAFLALDPNIIQWHGTFWTESIFISMQVFLIGMVIHKNKTNFFCLLLGLFLGLIFLQKTVGVLFILFIVFYVFFTEVKYKLIKIFNINLGFFLVLILLGLDNFKKTGIFYVMPTQTKNAHYSVLVPQIFSEKKDAQAYIELKESEKKWKIENNFSEENFKNVYNLRKFEQKKAIEIILENKIITLKIYLKKIINHLILNPFQTYYWHKYNQIEYSNEEFHLSEESKKYFYFKVLYSLIFYIILLIGFIKIKNDKKNYKFHLLLMFLVSYLVFMLGWVGNSRYFVPSLIFLSIFFGHGIDYIKELRYKKI